MRFIVRAGAIVADPSSARGIVENGALVVEEGRIVAIGTFAGIRDAHPDLPVVGDETAIVIPGLINAHDHGRGVSPPRFGIEDDVLEMWIPSLMRMPALDPELDTALSALRQLKCGITTTVNSYYEPTQDDRRIAAVLSGYARSGIRAGLIYSAMDRPATTRLLEEAAGTMDDALRHAVQAYLSGRPGFDMTLYRDRINALADLKKTSRNWLMAGVVSGHWSSDAQLSEVCGPAEVLGLSWQMHLLESSWQARDNAGQAEGSLVRHLAALGILDERLSCAHCVQTDEDDLAVMAKNGTSIVHNLSSNLRLKSGIAPVAAMRRAGVTVALGLDSMDLHDRADMFEEMRMVHRRHGVLSAREVLQMATVDGARALGRADDIGTLDVGKLADFVVLNPADGAGALPCAAEDVCDWIIDSATPSAVRQVFVEGDCVIDNGRHPVLDEQELTDDLLARSLGYPPAASAEGLDLFSAAEPYIQALLAQTNQYVVKPTPDA